MKTLLVRLSSMGDLIHTLPAVSDLARHRPDIELHWLCEAAFADIARLHPFVAKVYPMRWRQWRKRLFQAAMRQEMAALYRDLRYEAYGQVLDSQSLLKSAVFARFAGVPVMGLDKNSARERLAACFYGRTFAVEKGRNAVWRNRRLFAQAFGYQESGRADFGIAVPETGRLPEKPPAYFVALHATSRDSKLWALHYWLAFLQQLYDTYRLPVLLPWGSIEERQRAEKIAGQLPFVQVCPKLDLLQAADVLQHARAVIGVDTGLLHLADAADVPLVGIYTDSDPDKTGVQPSERARNLGGIGQMPEPVQVWQALGEVLANG